jgi:glycosyltransferase involved in cell wall biosynthesis
MRILIDTNATPYLSFGKVATNVCKAFRTLGQEAYIRPWKKETDLKYLDFNLLEDTPHDDYDVHLRISQPDSFGVMSAPFNVAMFYYEMDKIPQSYIAGLNKPDLLWLPSHFVAKKLQQSGVHKPYCVIPTGIDTYLYTPAEVKWDRADPFTFLTVGTQARRKGTDVLIKAFQQEFAPDENVRLIIKTNEGANYGKELIDRDHEAQISWIEKDMSELDLLELYHRAHCYVTATRGEGFNMPVLEAKCLGLPVIATDWSGHLDFCNDSNTLLVLLECMSDGIVSSIKGQYAEPSQTHLMSQMRCVTIEYNNWSKIAYKQASQEIWPHYSWTAVTRKLLTQIQKRNSNVVSTRRR